MFNRCVIFMPVTVPSLDENAQEVTVVEQKLFGLNKSLRNNLLYSNSVLDFLHHLTVVI